MRHAPGFGQASFGAERRAERGHRPVRLGVRLLRVSGAQRSPGQVIAQREPQPHSGAQREFKRELEREQQPGPGPAESEPDREPEQERDRKYEPEP